MKESNAASFRYGEYGGGHPHWPERKSRTARRLGGGGVTGELFLRPPRGMGNWRGGMVEEASSAGAIEGATMATNWRVWRSGGYISLAERVTQRVPRGGFGEDSAPPAVSCGSWTKAQHQRGGYKRARREQKASALARAHLTEKSIGSCFRVISGKSRILLDRRKLDFRVRTTCFRCLGKV